ncbi:MAG: ABC transporter permease [Cyclobacteriaceae bacterium]|nr:ABC transporter permease [Cyclobacteriaceae bacterium]
MLRILKYSFFDLTRSWWNLVYFAFFLLVTFSLLYLSSDLSNAMISLMNIITILIPLVGTLFGVMHYYNSKEFTELLLAQPIKRKDIFLGQYLGLAVSLSAGFIVGLCVPFFMYGIFHSELFSQFIYLLATGILLTFTFSSISFLIALNNNNKMKGFALALVFWLFMAIVYDGLFLLLLVQFDEYPLEKFALGVSLFNPIDLSRVIIMLKLDIAALLGYTGAVFKLFFGSYTGVILSFSMLFVWSVAPILVTLKVASKKDF